MEHFHKIQYQSCVILTYLHFQRIFAPFYVNTLFYSNISQNKTFVKLQNAQKNGQKFNCPIFCKFLFLVKCQDSFHCLQQEEPEEDFGTGYCSKTQKHLWNLFENPHHSCAAKVKKILKMRQMPNNYL